VAPLLPLITEEIWRGLTGGRSVHLEDYPDAADLPADPALVAGMDRAREVCSTGSSLRKAQGLRARLPLASLTVVVPDPAALEPFEAIIRDELNVKSVSLVELGSDSGADYGVTQRLTVNARVAGPRLGKDVQGAIKGAKSGNWSVSADGAVTAGGLELLEGEYTLETVVATEDSGSSATAMLSGGGFVVLDTHVTPELASEGLARDLVRAVQQARRDAGLHVSDRISLTVTGTDAVFDATVAHRDLIVGETLATQFSSAGPDHGLPEGTGSTVVVGDGQEARIMVAKR
jgi:isoleucyl-tRNA synthetase